MSSPSRRQKKPVQCVMTFDAVKCSHPCDGKYFHIIWKRNKQNGSTEKCIADSQGCIVFHKTINVTFRVCTVEKYQKQKEMKIKLVESSGLKSKTIAKLSLNIVDFHKSPNGDRNILMKPKVNIRAPEITLSVLTRYIDDEKVNLDSVTDSALISDRLSAFDGSQSPETARRKSVLALHQQAKRPPPLPRQRVSNEGSEEMAAQTRASINMFFAAGKPKSRRRNNSMQLSQQPDLKDIDSSDSKLSETVDYSTISEQFDKFLSDTIPYSDTSLTDFDGGDSMIFALMNHFDIIGDLGDSLFARFLDETAMNIIESNIVVSMDKRRKFFPLYGLLVLFKHPPADVRVSYPRCNALFEMFLTPTARALSFLVKSYITLFDATIDVLFEQCNDEEATKTLTQDLENFIIACQIPKQFVPVVQKVMVAVLDTHIMTVMIRKYGHKCTFMNSCAWNSLCTVMRSDLNIEFVKFSEAISALQMAQSISEDPPMLEHLCPHIKPATALTIMETRQVDEMMMKKPNMHNFKAHYRITNQVSDIEELSISTICRMIGESLEKVDTSTWKNINVPEKFREEYDFIAKYFS